MKRESFFVFLIFLFVIGVDFLFAQGGRFIGETWVSDSALTVGNIPFTDNVGIGTTLMNAKLVVQGNGLSATYTTLQVRKFNGLPSLTVKDDGKVGIGTSLPQGTLIVQGGGSGITFQAQDSAASKLVTLLDNGNLGIGSTVPQKKLDVVGNVAINQTSGTAEIFKLTCTQGALNSCACYTSTISNKIGSIKVDINGMTGWIDVRDQPN